MESWNADDEGILVRLEAEGCEAGGGEVWVLLDAWGDVDRLFEDECVAGDQVDETTTWELEDGELIGVLMRSYRSGRVNYVREVELADLEPRDESAGPDEDEVRARVRRYRSRRSAD